MTGFAGVRRSPFAATMNVADFIVFQPRARSSGTRARALSLEAKASAESFKLAGGTSLDLVFSAENTVTPKTIVGQLSGLVGPTL